MIRQSESKQAESLQLEDRDTIQSPPDSEIMPIAEMVQEDVEIQKSQKPKRSLLLWSIYSLLGFGIIAAIAPIFLTQTNGCGVSKGRSSEAKAYIGSSNRAQQALWVENGAFGRSISNLGIGIQEETVNHKYEIQSFKLVSYQYAISKNDKSKSFVGAVFILPENSQIFQSLNQQVKYPKDSTQFVKKDLATFPILCESPEGVKAKLPKPFLNNGKPTCPEGTISIN